MHKKQKETASETERVTTSGTVRPMRDYPGFILQPELQHEEKIKAVDH